MQTVLRFAGQAALALIFVACLYASALIAVMGVVGVAQDLSRDQTGAAIRSAVYASLMLAAAVALGGLALRGLWVLQRRAAPPPAGFDVLPPR